MIENTASKRRWAHELVSEATARAREAVDRVRARPTSSKRVHRARKALAQLEAAYADLDSLVGKGDDLATLAPQLHRAAGQIRNADVACKRLARYAAKATGAECDQIALLRKKLKKRRVRAIDKFCRNDISEGKAAAFRPRAIDLSACTSTDEVIGEIVRVRTAEMLQFAPALGGADDESLHAFRLRCKLLRYTLQRFGAECLGLGAVELFLSELLDALGAAHDCAALERRAARNRCMLVAIRAQHERARHLEDAAWIWLSGSRVGGEIQTLATYSGFTAVAA